MITIVSDKSNIKTGCYYQNWIFKKIHLHCGAIMFDPRDYMDQLVYSETVVSEISLQ